MWSLVFPLLVTCHTSFASIRFSVWVRAQWSHFWSAKFMVTVIALTFCICSSVLMLAFDDSGLKQLVEYLGSLVKIGNYLVYFELLRNRFRVNFKLKFEFTIWICELCFHFLNFGKWERAIHKKVFFKVTGKVANNVKFISRHL